VDRAKAGSTGPRHRVRFAPLPSAIRGIARRFRSAQPRPARTRPVAMPPSFPPAAAPPQPVTVSLERPALALSAWEQAWLGPCQ
jgi:hypothetical protein